jgi:hypothetical protein
MKIPIRYKRIGQSAFAEIDLRPEDYFEPVDEDRPLTWDDVSQHPHPVGYLPVPAREISETSLRISDGDRILLRLDEVLWNDGKNRFLRRNDGRVDLIVVTVRDGDRWHIARFNRRVDGNILFEQVGARRARRETSPRQAAC